MSRYSQSRLESKIMQAVSLMIVQGEIKHPDLSTFCSVNRVVLSSDNGYCTIYITSPMGEKDLDKSVAALQSAKGFIQGRLGRHLKTKNTPVLTFKRDIAFEKGEQVDRLIESLNKEK